jgi:mRNA-degrading endonuclease RelE of RelBE toxin-antitoxin system
MFFSSLPEFDRDLKKLKKRFRTLNEDIEVLKKVLEVNPDALPPLSFRISGTGTVIPVIKVKKFSCKALKGSGANSGIRVIYAYYKEKQEIKFVEIYFKGDKETEEKERFKLL